MKNQKILNLLNETNDSKCVKKKKKYGIVSVINHCKLWCRCRNEIVCIAEVRHHHLLNVSQKLMEEQ